MRVTASIERLLDQGSGDINYSGQSKAFHCLGKGAAGTMSRYGMAREAFIAQFACH